MKLDLIQPFIRAAGTVLAANLQCETRVEELSMDDSAYRRHGMAAEIRIAGDLEGRVILDLDPQIVLAVAKSVGDCSPADAGELAHETICELANQVIGNAVTALNDRGFRFRIQPPLVHRDDTALRASEDTEALRLSINTCRGRAYLNIALRYAGSSEL